MKKIFPQKLKKEVEKLRGTSKQETGTTVLVREKNITLTPRGISGGVNIMLFSAVNTCKNK